MIEGVVSTTYDTTWGDVESVDEVVEDMEDLIVAVFSTTDRIKNKAEELQNNGSISEEEKNKIDTDRLVIEAAAVALENEKAAAAELQELAENEKDADKKKELQEQAKEKLEDIKKDAEKVKEAADNLERKLGIGKDKDITIGKDGYFDGTIKLSDVKNPKNSIITDGKDINNAPKLFSSVKYAKENRILNRHLGDKKKLVITNSEVTQKEIDSLKKIVANPGKDHLLWVHYDLKTQEIKYKISFTNTFFGELRILREEYVKLYNNILTANIKASIGAAIINASEHLDLLLEEYKDHISFVNQELIAGRTTYDVLKSILSFTKKCAGDFKSQQKGIVPKCLWNDNDHLAMAYYAGFIDAAWEGGEMIVALYKFKAAWDPLDSFFLNAEAFKIRQQTIDIVLLIRQLDKEDSLVSSVTSTIKKEFVKYVDETLALDPQARYNQGKLIFDIASFFIGYGEVKAFLKTGKITSATFKSLRKIPSTLQKTIVGFGKFGKKLLVKIDHVTGEVLIKGQKIARLNKEKLTLYVKALSESIDDNLQPVGQLITPEGYLVKLDDGRSISDRVFNIIGDTNGKYKVAVAKLADVGGDLLSGLKTKLANKLDDTQWKKFEVDFGNNTDLLKKFDENPELVDSWKVISNSPHSTDLDFIKFFDDVDVVSARNIVANNSAMRSKFPDMSVEELTAIYHYTTDAYHDLNRALRGLDPMTDQLDAFNKALSNSMDKLPKYTNTTYRGSPVPESVLNNYKNTFDNKTNVIEDAFTSTSKESNVAVSFADDVIKDGDVRVFFTVEGKNGVDIEDISAYGPSFDPSYSESEILFKSGLEFKVSNFEDTFDGSGNRLVLITLTE
ncbi:hypothetical protein USCSP91_700001 [Tenacibaculum maritimum]|nr:hypothetical protein USCSP91_700001 [Tenacibaculum maritimum]